MNDIEHFALSEHCRNLRALDKTLQGLKNRRWAAKKANLPPQVIVPMEAAIVTISQSYDAHDKGLGGFRRFLDEEIQAWLAEPNGVGDKIIYLMGLIPQLCEFPSPAYLHSYCGFAVKNGVAPRATRGKKLGHNALLTATIIGRIVPPIIKLTGEPDKNGRVRALSPYRGPYEDRKLWTLKTHPPMREPGECPFCDEATAKNKKHREGHDYTRQRTAIGEDCSNLGGAHWTDGHRDNDARRIVGREVLIDLWRTGHGQKPRYGMKESQGAADNHIERALHAVL